MKVMNCHEEREKDNQTALAGQRLTAQRLLILDLLREGEHLNVDELHWRVKAKLPRVNLSTVYRNLGLFS